mmetsp:Transcript_10064/g.30007  ORF Transcript_10064/g.30007 Transcript_10064/m.30007 type:complete len:201 (+) Transcript_10064:376-978(+)
MPEAAARSRMASRGKASDSSKRGTYLSSIAAVRTDRSPCKLARTSCAGGNAAACPNLCTYLRATQCSPARTIILSTSPGPASPSTERHRAPHALRAPSYLQERERGGGGPVQRQPPRTRPLHPRAASVRASRAAAWWWGTPSAAGTRARTAAPRRTACPQPDAARERTCRMPARETSGAHARTRGAGQAPPRRRPARGAP